MAWIRALVVLALVFTTSSAAAQAAARCRDGTAADVEEVADYAPIPGLDASSFGYCGDDGTCFVIGNVRCALAADDTGSVLPSVLQVPGATLLVFRWSYDHGGSDYWGGHATEVWRVDGAPTFLFSVIEDYTEGEASMDGEHDRDVCAITRSVAVDASGVVLGRRTARGACRAVFTTFDRRGTRVIPAAAAHWTWSQLGVPPPAAPPAPH